MGKVVKFTGSQLLGEELRRLRGPRTLAEIAGLSRSEPLSKRIEPVSAPSLCQIESGQTFPGLALLHSLSVIYRVSVQRLLNLVVEERLSTGSTLPADEAATDEAHARALGAGRWLEDVSLCIHGERLAATERRKVAWRARRGSALHKAGMRDESIAVLMSCIESPALEPARRAQIRLNLADALMSAGLLEMTRAVLQSEDLTSLTSEPVKARFLRRKARLNLELAKTNDAESERLARESLRWIAEARKLASAETATDTFSLDVLEAFALSLSGNRALALRELEACVERAESEGNEQWQVVAGLTLAQIECEGSASDRALRRMENVASLAFRLGLHDESFEAAFALHLAYSTRDTKLASHYLKRCGSLHPLLVASSPSVRGYESLALGRG